MSRQDDLAVNRDIRRVLVRHWIDLGVLSIRTTGGVVRVCGVLNRLHHTPDVLTGSAVGNLFKEIRANRQVKRIVVTLDNWTDSEGGWKQVGKGGGGVRVGEKAQSFKITGDGG